MGATAGEGYRFYNLLVGFLVAHRVKGDAGLDGSLGLCSGRVLLTLLGTFS